MPSQFILLQTKKEGKTVTFLLQVCLVLLPCILGRASFTLHFFALRFCPCIFYFALFVLRFWPCGAMVTHALIDHRVLYLFQQLHAFGLQAGTGSSFPLAQN